MGPLQRTCRGAERRLLPGCRAGDAGQQEEFSAVEVGRSGFVAARSHTVYTHVGKAVTLSEEPQFAGRPARRPEVERALVPLGAPYRGFLVVDAPFGVEGVVILEEPHLEIGGERAHGDGASGLPGPDEIGEHGKVVGFVTRETETALAERDDGIEVTVERQRRRVDYLEGAGLEALLGGGPTGQLDEVVGDVDAGDLGSPSPEGESVTAGATPDVEHPVPRFEAQRAPQEFDLLSGALGEGHYTSGIRCPVGLSQVRGDRLEPMCSRIGHLDQRSGSTRVHMLACQRTQNDGSRQTAHRPTVHAVSPAEIAYREAIRALEHQDAVFDGFRTRSNLLLTGAAVASSILAIQGADFSAWLWLGAAAFAVMIACVAGVHWPRHWESTWNAHILVGEYVEGGYDADEMYRQLAVYGQDQWLRNDEQIGRVRGFFVGALVALAVTMGALLLNLAVNHGQGQESTFPSSTEDTRPGPLSAGGQGGR